MNESIYTFAKKLMEKTWILFPIAVLLNCSTTCLASTVTDLASDKAALLALKAHVTSDPEHALANSWSTAASVCSWIGVSCGLRRRRVTALHLSDMGLTGTIVPHIGNLSSLTSLVISYNNFHGCIPQELANLRELQKIDLGYNNLSGEVPAWLGMLPELQYLFLDNNGFTGSIPPSLSNLSKLELLNTTNNLLHGNIPEGIGNLSNLVSLSLRNNKLTGSMPSSIFNMSSVRMIDVTANNLSDSLPLDMCTHLSKLERLYLSMNQFYGQIPSNLYKCGELRYLSLSFNAFNGSIPREIGSLPMLKELYLGWNSFQGKIPMEIGNLSRLEVFSIQSGSMAGPLPPFIFNISSLKTIDFGNNSFSGSIPVKIPCVFEELFLSDNQLTGHIPSDLWDCRRLRRISLSKNQFTGSISKNIGNLTLLRDLYLFSNNMTGTLPDEIGSINLETLNVHENSLTGPIPFKIFNVSTMKVIDLGFNHFSGHLPRDMGLWLPNLEELYLGSNKLSGTIPNSISNASRITILSLTSNSFTGSIPNTLGSLRLLRRLLLGENNLTKESSTSELRFFSSLTNCRQLEILSISLNQFNGALPISVGNLSTSLDRFEAFGCKIKGNIPSGIGNLSSLNVISLDSNELTGPVPTTIGRLLKLERLYVEHNTLEGEIPHEICRLRNLGDLYVSDNHLYGPIPSCLGEIKTLRRLYLDSNKLTSEIPSSLWSLRDLLGLNLSSNSLSGYLPLAVGNLKVITELDLSWNLVSGDIPNTIGGAQSLVFLSLAHNSLGGAIPRSLGDLISLEFLDLSGNNLSGLIPKSLEMLRYLQYFNVSFNRLQGEIPTGGRFANFTAQSFARNDALCGVPRLQVPSCKTSMLSRSSSKILHILKYILATVASAILLGTLIFLSIRCRKQEQALPVQVTSSPFEQRRVPYQELLRATGAFSEANLLGVGGFGSVYKGVLPDGMTVAVKVFNLELEGAFKSFDVECEVMSNIRHRNLVRIISSCSNIDFKALVSEYMPNGSLQSWLYSENCHLDILQRLNIMIDVASALEYLHHCLPTPIVHCDLKPNNILLDEDMTAHVGDFGIAKLLGDDGDFMAQTMTLATIGYMAPEYGAQGIVSTSGDVYSYGIVLMETFTRKSPTDEMFGGEMSLKLWVSKALEGSVTEVADINLIGRSEEDDDCSVKDQCVSLVLGLAMDCSNDLPEQRVNMRDALARLEKIKASFLSKVKGLRMAKAI